MLGRACRSDGRARIKKRAYPFRGERIGSFLSLEEQFPLEGFPGGAVDGQVDQETTQ